MSLHRTMGNSLVCSVTSACAIAEAPEKSVTHYPDESTGATSGNAEPPTDKSRSFTCRAVREQRSADYGSEWSGSWEPDW